MNKKRVTISVDKKIFEKFKDECKMAPYSKAVEYLMKKATEGGAVAEPDCIVIKLLNGDMQKLRSVCMDMGVTIPVMIKKLLDNNLIQSRAWLSTSVGFFSLFVNYTTASFGSFRSFHEKYPHIGSTFGDLSVHEKSAFSVFFLFL